MKIRERLGLFGYLFIIGVLATTTMDVTALSLLKSGAIGSLGLHIVPNLLGRWVSYFPSGIVFHSTILETPPRAHEVVIGILTHNFIGIALSALLLYPYTTIWRARLSLWTAVLFGVGTCVFPFFIMFPAMGFGMLGHNVTRESALIGFSALNHLAFGIGIYLWSNLLFGPFLHCSRPVLLRPTVVNPSQFRKITGSE